MPRDGSIGSEALWGRVKGRRAASAMRRYMIQKPPSFWIRLILGAVFVIASVNKIHQPTAFAKTLHNYQLLPDAFINLTAIILPWLELLLGILLISGLWLPGAALLANLLLLVFFGALLFQCGPRAGRALRVLLHQHRRNPGNHLVPHP